MVPSAGRGRSIRSASRSRRQATRCMRRRCAITKRAPSRRARSARPACSTTRRISKRSSTGWIEPPILLGHSLGGLLAQMLAARGKARALVLLAPCRALGRLAVDAVRDRVGADHAARRRLLEPAAEAGLLGRRGQFARSPAADRTPEDLCAIRAGVRAARPSRSCIGAGTRSRAAHVEARDVTCPILCLVGEHDRSIRRRRCAASPNAIRAASSIEEVAGHSHWLIGEPGWEKIAERTLAVA